MLVLRVAVVIPLQTVLSHKLASIDKPSNPKLIDARPATQPPAMHTTTVVACKASEEQSLAVTHALAIGTGVPRSNAQRASCPFWPSSERADSLAR